MKFILLFFSLFYSLSCSKVYDYFNQVEPIVDKTTLTDSEMKILSSVQDYLSKSYFEKLHTAAIPYGQKFVYKSQEFIIVQREHPKMLHGSFVFKTTNDYNDILTLKKDYNTKSYIKFDIFLNKLLEQRSLDGGHASKVQEKLLIFRIVFITNFGINYK